MEKRTVITIRSEQDIDDYVDSDQYFSPSEISKEKHKELMKEMLVDKKQYAFIKETGNVIAAISNEGELQAIYFNG